MSTTGVVRSEREAGKFLAIDPFAVTVSNWSKATQSTLTNWRYPTWAEECKIKKFSEERFKSVTFHSGDVGFSHDLQSGSITEVIPNGQAGLAGVRVGWAIDEVDGRPYSASLLQQLAAIAFDFTVKFERREKLGELPEVSLAPPEPQSDCLEPGLLWSLEPAATPLPPLAPEEVEEELPLAPEERQLAAGGAEIDSPVLAPPEGGDRCPKVVCRVEQVLSATDSGSQSPTLKHFPPPRTPPPESPRDCLERGDLWNSESSPSATPLPPLAPEEEEEQLPLAPEEVPRFADRLNSPILAPQEEPPLQDG